MISEFIMKSDDAKGLCHSRNFSCPVFLLKHGVEQTRVGEIKSFQFT